MRRRGCHAKMDGDKAVGIDGITKEDYSRDLEKNLSDLVERMKRRAYHPKPARRVEIPKDNGKTRPLSIYCYEDKLVQFEMFSIYEVLPEILELWGTNLIIDVEAKKNRAKAAGR